MYVRNKQEDTDKFHNTISQSLHILKNNKTFQTLPIRTADGKLVFTTVSRVFLGEPGLTTLYFNLRIFPYTFDTHNDDEIASAAKCIFESGNVLHQNICRDSNCIGSHSIALLNFFDPTTVHPSSWPQDSYFNLGRLAINWHQDPALQKNSCVLVYQVNAQVSGQHDTPWTIATCPLSGKQYNCFALHSGDSYVIEGHFNDTNYHAVIAGSSERISVVYRNIQREGNQIADVFHEANQVCEMIQICLSENKVDSASILRFFECIYTVEFEWIRKFWFLGQEHADRHKYYWLPWIEHLETYWLHLTSVGTQIFQLIENLTLPWASSSICHTILECSQKLQEGREEWNELCNHPRFALHPEIVPVKRPSKQENNIFSGDLYKIILFLSHTPSAEKIK